MTDPFASMGATAEARTYVESQGEGWRTLLEQAISTSIKERAPDMAGRIGELLLEGPGGAAQGSKKVSFENLHVECDSLQAPPSAARAPSLGRRFTVANMDPKIIAAKYAVRGTVAVRAGELKGALARGDELPFDKLTLCNIGNPHAVQQKPITYYRQVASALYSPELTKEGGGALATLYPEDVIARAKAYHAATNGSGMGAYTDSAGLQLVRDEVAAFLLERDGYPAIPAHIALTTGASEGVKRCIGALVRTARDGIMIPKPQYPLYSAALTMVGGRAVYYGLTEEAGWTTSWAELERAYAEAVAEGTALRALAMINPGNPVGAVLSEAAVAELICFAAAKGLVVLADEVYQLNVYAEGAAFYSCKQVLRKLQAGVLKPPELARGVAACGTAELAAAQLISFHSTSKGLIGECGQRGGYLEMVGFSDATRAQFTKVAATSLSSGTIGQCFVGMMVSGPKEGEPSYSLFAQESADIMAGLKRRALQATSALNDLEGISCQPIEGAMYAFPSLALPAKFVARCAEAGQAADEAWCLELMEATGIVCVPGSGFGQEEGSFHARLTILPPDDVFSGMLTKLAAFQAELHKEWA
jgi:alanine transaminase